MFKPPTPTEPLKHNMAYSSVQSFADDLHNFDPDRLFCSVEHAMQVKNQKADLLCQLKQVAFCQPKPKDYPKFCKEHHSQLKCSVSHLASRYQGKASIAAKSQSLSSTAVPPGKAIAIVEEILS